MAVVGEHIVVELIGVRNDIIDDVDLMKRTVEEITELTEVDILDVSYHKFTPNGLTLVALLSTSHISFHTFPEINFISFDYFTCGTKSPSISVDILKKNYNPENLKIHSLKRGYIIKDIYEKEGYFGGYIVDEEIAHVKTRVGQDIKILKIKDLGNCLFCNDEMNLAAKDEQLYHEPFGDRAFEMLGSDAPAKVIILGGGDGGMARECLKRNIDEIKILELDEEVIELSKKHLPSVSGGAFDHPKVKCVIGDAFQTILQIPDGSQDIVFADLTDYAYRLIMTNIDQIKRVLKPGGIIAAQIGATDLAKTQVESYYGKIKELFTDCDKIDIYVPSYINRWSLAFGVKKRQAGL
ncbi:MAG: adenosylmethionine decarboxylase [Spirochaetes bacterium]|jgi:spermidine synthase|nr:adenosylmethionine decarboxylase [Spirochaetota bacterium]